MGKKQKNIININYTFEYYSYQKFIEALKKQYNNKTKKHQF